MEETKQERCSDLVKGACEGRLEDIKTLFEAEDQTTEDLGNLCDYGLCIDLVEAGTFKGQREDYIRYQLSYGGPSEEFRLYKNGDLEFWYLDWFDGAKVDITDNKDAWIIKDIIENSGVSFNPVQ
jgi:hypothetical protein